LWRTIKYEEVYLHDYQSVGEGKLGIGRYIEFYNHVRLHQALNYRRAWGKVRGPLKRGGEFALDG
jgi:hypothetical protein